VLHTRVCIFDRCSKGDIILSSRCIFTFTGRHWGLSVIVAVLLASVGLSMSGYSANAQPGSVQRASAASPDRLVLAFYYPWYSYSDWCPCRMPDVPMISYNSADGAIIDRQLQWAANAGLNGFISSWWGQGDQTDTNFANLLAHSTTLEQTAGYHFASTIYFESDSPHLQGEANMVDALRYVIAQYSNNPHFLHWRGKPVIFVWDPLGHGRTLALWASVLQQVDPQHRVVWSAEGVNMHLLDVFDGIHLFSAGYWGLLDGDMAAVDQGFRNKVNAYNAAHGTHKIWAAGVMPGYDDTRVPGRQGTFKVPRDSGATYHTSWEAAIASNPDWITITSFNEWFEGSMIEPSVTYKTLYLAITQHYTNVWHG
jgi:hypothetical protein